jgi:hypothetical protein
VQAGFLEKHKDVDVVYTCAKLVETDKEGRWLPARTEVQKRVFSTDGTLMLQEFCSLPVFAINAPLLRRRVFDKVGYFDVELDSYEDWQFWLRCAIEECRLHTWKRRLQA